MLYWISWISVNGEENPIIYPPLPEVMGYWISGYTADDNSTMCALILADDENNAMNIICKYWDIKEIKLRFCKIADVNIVSNNNQRFKLPKWSPLLKELEVVSNQIPSCNDSDFLKTIKNQLDLYKDPCAFGHE